MKKIRNIIFDWDNTLFPFKKYWEIAHRRIFLDLFDFDEQLTIDDFMEIFSRFDEQVWNEVYAGNLTAQEAREERVRLTLDHFGISYKEIFVRNFFDIFLTTLMKEIRQDEQLLTRIKKLSERYKIVILSNGESWEQREKIRQFGFESLFPVYISGETGFVKPDFRAFENILIAENFLPDETLMVGDLIEHDILPAQQLGLLTAFIGKTTGKIADFEFLTLDDFLYWIENRI